MKDPRISVHINRANMNIEKCLAVYSYCSKFITVHVTFVTKELQASTSLKMSMLGDINIECHPELLGTLRG